MTSDTTSTPRTVDDARQAVLGALCDCAAGAEKTPNSEVAHTLAVACKELADAYRTLTEVG